MSQKNQNTEQKDKSIKTGDQQKVEQKLLFTPQKLKQHEFKTTEKSDNKFLSLIIEAPTLKLHQKVADKYTGCNCRKSQCLKMYCVCFSSGKMCDQTCLCDTCANKTDNILRSQAINAIITRDPYAFSRNDNSKPQTLSDGCNCKKSNCTKKYCECFRKGKGCNKNCSCLECENIHKISQSESRTIGQSKKRTKLQ